MEIEEEYVIRSKWTGFAQEDIVVQFDRHHIFMEGREKAVPFRPSEPQAGEAVQQATSQSTMAAKVCLLLDTAS